MQNDIKFIYSIKDIPAEEWGPIFEANNHAVAKRAMEATINRTQFPEDFELVCVGQMEKGNLVIKPAKHLIICNGGELRDEVLEKVKAQEEKAGQLKLVEEEKKKK